MADDDKKKGGDAVKDLWFIIGILALLVIIWVASGGPKRSTVKSLFINSPLSVPTTTPDSPTP